MNTDNNVISSTSEYKHTENMSIRPLDYIDDQKIKRKVKYTQGNIEFTHTIRTASFNTCR